MANSAPRLERLHELFIYDSESGLFTRRLARGGHREGSIAGNIDPVNGYIRIRIDTVSYKAHRLAWLYMTGEWPPELIDHINGNRADNRFVNLRLATIGENNQNVQCARKDSRSGLRGVSWFKNQKKWRAVIGVNGKQCHIGYFDSAEEASAAYLQAKSKLHQFWSPPEVNPR